MSLNSIGSIATFILQSIPNISLGISGNMTSIVDLSRQYVANYTGINIDENNIPVVYQPAIVSFSKADTVDLLNAEDGTGALSLGELSMNETGQMMSAEQWRKLGEKQLEVLGRACYFVRSLS